MNLQLQLMGRTQLIRLSGKIVTGRLLSLNIGKAFCVGVLHVSAGFCMVNYALKLYESMPVKRGDIITATGYCKGLSNSKYVLNLTAIHHVIACKGKLPNKQFKGESDLHSIVQVMFQPERFQLLKLRADLLRNIRVFLYEEGFDEIQTPVMFNKCSPSNATSFSLETLNKRKLYIKSIHEHLLKPYLLVGFDRIFEIGSVFRNIGYSHEYDCEFTNLDIWLKFAKLDYLIDLCVQLVQLICTAQGLPRMQVYIADYDDYIELNHLNCTDSRQFKQYIRNNSMGKLIILRHYPRIRNLHTKATEDGLHNLEFHGFANGISFAHGYEIDTAVSALTDSASSNQCHFFEEYSVYGIEPFSGIGIGIEKLLQGILEVKDFHQFNLYRRRY